MCQFAEDDLANTLYFKVYFSGVNIHTIYQILKMGVALSAITINSAHTQVDVLRKAGGRPRQTSKRAVNYI